MKTYEVVEIKTGRSHMILRCVQLFEVTLDGISGRITRITSIKVYDLFASNA